MAKKKQKRIARRSSAIKKQRPLNSECQALLNHALNLERFGQATKAKSLLEQVLAVFPNHAETNFLLGELLFRDAQYPQAYHFFKTACELVPTNLKYLQTLGDKLLRSGNALEAESFFNKTVLLAPRDFAQFYNLGSVQNDLSKFAEAVANLKKAIKLKPDFVPSYNNLANALLGLCQIKPALGCYKKCFKLGTPTLASYSNYLFNSNYDNELSDKDLFDRHVEIGLHYPKPEVTTSRLANKPKIRIGFVSPDFRKHSVAYFLWPLLENLDDSKYEIFCYYNHRQFDEVTRKFQTRAYSWTNTLALDDQTLAAKIRADVIDVLVDLAGHSMGNRLAIFALRAAPIQITWLGYPHTSGIPAMDYRIVDNITDPVPEADQFTQERLIRFANGFLCYQGDEKVSYNKESPFLTNGHVTFASFNSLLKVNQHVINTWAEILVAVPDSRIIVKAKQLGDESVRDRYLAYFEKAGIEKSRVRLVGRTPATRDHLTLYNQVDLALDSFPYNGTTTTCEGLWMGVPTVTFLGSRHASRVGASIMKHSGLKDFVAESLADYKAKAITLGLKPEPLVDLRRNLREQIQGSILCNATRFTKEMEAVFLDLLS